MHISQKCTYTQYFKPYLKYCILVASQALLSATVSAEPYRSDGCEAAGNAECPTGKTVHHSNPSTTAAPGSHTGKGKVSLHMHIQVKVVNLDMFVVVLFSK